MKPWVTYTLVRLLLFAGILAILLLVAVPGYFAAIIAAVVAFCISYLFLGRQRAEVSRLVAESRAKGDTDAEPSIPAAAGSDEEAEDFDETDAAAGLEGDRPGEK